MASLGNNGSNAQSLRSEIGAEKPLYPKGPVREGDLRTLSSAFAGGRTTMNQVAQLAGYLDDGSALQDYLKSKVTEPFNVWLHAKADEDKERDVVKPYDQKVINGETTQINYHTIVDAGSASVPSFGKGYFKTTDKVERVLARNRVDNSDGTNPAGSYNPMGTPNFNMMKLRNADLRENLVVGDKFYSRDAGTEFVVTGVKKSTFKVQQLNPDRISTNADGVEWEVKWKAGLATASKPLTTGAKQTAILGPINRKSPLA